MKSLAKLKLPSWARTIQPNGVKLYSSNATYDVCTTTREKWTEDEDLYLPTE